jgi:hypothetical protein
MAKMPVIPEATSIGAEVRLWLRLVEGDHGCHCLGLSGVTPFSFTRVTPDLALTGHSNTHLEDDGDDVAKILQAWWILF